MSAFAETIGIIPQNGSCEKKFNVLIEGNIAVGKTTMVKYFSKFKNIETFSEPVDQWRNLHGHNLFDLMHKDTKRWSMAFQSYAQLTMINLHSKKQVQPVRLMERSLYSSRYCFVENLYRTKQIPDEEYLVLNEWFNWLIDNVNFPVDLIVYLRADPEVAHQRVMSRSRPEECTLPIEYVRAIHELHDEWLVDQTPFSVPAPVLILDANNDLESMFKLFESKRDEILCNQQC